MTALNPHPLFTRLVDQLGAAWVTPDTADAFLARPGAAALLFTGDPVRFPEALDLAVVLPELRAPQAEPFAIGVADRAGEDALARRWGVQRWPSIVFLRDGRYLATLSGMKDWDVFLAEVREALAATPSRPPTVGIPVVGAGGGSACP